MYGPSAVLHVFRNPAIFSFTFPLFETDLFLISHFFFCFPHSKFTFELHFELNLVSRNVLSTKDCANYYFSSLSVPTVPVTSSPTPTTTG